MWDLQAVPEQQNFNFFYEKNPIFIHNRSQWKIQDSGDIQLPNPGLRLSLFWSDSGQNLPTNKHS